MQQTSIKPEWVPVVVDYLYIAGDRLENVFAHAKVIHGYREDSYEYYEIMIPSHNFFTCYIDADKIEEFLWKLMNLIS